MSSSKSLIVAVLVACGGSALLSGAPAEDAAAKKAGVKRICVSTSGTGGDAAREPILSMLTSDLGILDAVALTQKLDVLRQAEIKKDDCDFVFEGEFDSKAAKPGGGGGGVLSRASRATGAVSSSAGNLGAAGTAQSRVGSTNDSAANLSTALAPNPKDKVKIAFKVFAASNTKTPVLTREKEVLAADLQKYIETMINDVANIAVK